MRSTAGLILRFALAPAARASSLVPRETSRAASYATSASKSLGLSRAAKKRVGEGHRWACTRRGTADHRRQTPVSRQRRAQPTTRGRPHCSRQRWPQAGVYPARLSSPRGEEPRAAGAAAREGSGERSSAYASRSPVRRQAQIPDERRRRASRRAFAARAGPRRRASRGYDRSLWRRRVPCRPERAGRGGPRGRARRNRQPRPTP